MRLREAGRRGRLVGLAALVVLACGCPSIPAGGEPIDLRPAKTPAQLTALLKEISTRPDPEACCARARIYARLREIDETSSSILMSRGDEADIELMSRPSSEDLKSESADRLARHYLERSRRPGAAPFLEPLPASLRRLALVTIASTFAEYAGRDLKALALEELARALDRIAATEDLRIELQQELLKRSNAASISAGVVRAAEEKGEPTAEARRFCEVELGRHLDEATRAADQGTREKAARGDPIRTIDAYLSALTHYLVAREVLVSPTPAQDHSLSGMEIVVRSVSDLLRKDP